MSFEDEFSWTLQVHPLSLLHQDLDKKNLTLKYLKNLQPEKGWRYIKKICEVLTLLDDVRTVVFEGSLSMDIIIELEDILRMGRAMVQRSIDGFTYVILSNIERDMV